MFARACDIKRPTFKNVHNHVVYANMYNPFTKFLCILFTVETVISSFKDKIDYLTSTVFIVT